MTLLYTFLVYIVMKAESVSDADKSLVKMAFIPTMLLFTIPFDIILLGVYNGL